VERCVQQADRWHLFYTISDSSSPETCQAVG
jgi:hypothetical protein